MSRPSLTDLTAFVAVADHRSFRRAAEEIGTAPSTLSHAIRALEDRMGVRLLNRTTRSVSPTEAGFQLLARLRPALATLDEALDSVSAFRGNVSGAVRINAPRVAAAMLVDDIVPLMAERFPDVIVDIVVEGKLIDIVSGGFDAGVRLAGSIHKDMVSVQLGSLVEFVCVASPDYLSRHGEPGTPEELSHHRCIGHRMPGGKLYRWEFARAGQELTVDTVGPVILDDEDLMVDAAVKGLGIAYVTSPAATAALTDGRVRRVLGPWTPAPEAIAIYYPGHRRVQPALRAFLDTVKTIRRGSAQP